MNAAAAKKLKVGFVSQPWDSVLPAVQRSSLPIWTAEVAGRLARWCDVIVYALRHGSQRAAETHRGVRYHRLSAAPDRYASQMTRLLPDRRWTTLGNVAGGEFLERFFQEHEIFRRYTCGARA